MNVKTLEAMLAGFGPDIEYVEASPERGPKT